jgi:hypothetical protein
MTENTAATEQSGTQNFNMLGIKLPEAEDLQLLL